MKSKIEKRYDGFTSTVHQTGALISQSKGINVVLHLKNNMPYSAEVFSDDCEEYAALGLEMEGTELVGYDGCFEIPREVCMLLQENGFTVESSCLPDNMPQPAAYPAGRWSTI